MRSPCSYDGVLGAMLVKTRLHEEMGPQCFGACFVELEGARCRMEMNPAG
jgi:hypothetical protein